MEKDKENLNDSWLFIYKYINACCESQSKVIPSLFFLRVSPDCVFFYSVRACEFLYEIVGCSFVLSDTVIRSYI